MTPKSQTLVFKRKKKYFKNLSGLVIDSQKYIIWRLLYFVDTFDCSHFLLVSTSSSSNGVGCSSCENLNWGPDLENLPSSLLITGCEPAMFSIATQGCQNCRSINDTMWLFNSLHFSSLVSLPSFSKMPVLDG